MRWIFIVLLMCNGIYFLWQHYLVQREQPVESATASQPPADMEQLVLLSERQAPATDPAGATQAAPEQGAAPEQKPKPEPEAKPQPAICWQIGPFKEEVSRKQVANRLAAMDIELQLQTLEIPDKPDYWVHIPPQVSRREAIKLLRELQAKNIDSFLITEGELANGISLGFFTQKDRAENIHQQRREQGYDARIKTVERSHKELWAVFNERRYGELSDALWEKITEGNQGLERRKNYCDKIASAGNIE